MLARLIILALLFSLPAVAADKLCDASTKAGIACTCDVRKLRPLQGAIGMEEVRDKTQKIVAKEKKEWKDLEKDPIKCPNHTSS